MFAFSPDGTAMKGRARNFLPDISFWRLVAAVAVSFLLVAMAHGADTLAPANPSGAAAPDPAVAGATGKPVEPDAGATKIHRNDFDFELPLGWQVDTAASDYNADANFMLFSPKSTSVQFIIYPKTQEPKKIVDDALKNIDGIQITTLSRSSLSEWCGHKGVGMYLKGKIVDSFPGGIKVFCFSSPKHNVLVIETSFSDDLKDTQTDINTIGQHFKMSN